MNDRRSTDDSGQTMEGEYISSGSRHDDPDRTINELVEDMSRFVAENPKKTAVIVVASVAAAVAAATTAAAATAVFVMADEMKKWWRKPNG